MLSLRFWWRSAISTCGLRSTRTSAPAFGCPPPPPPTPAPAPATVFLLKPSSVYSVVHADQRLRQGHMGFEANNCIPFALGREHIRCTALGRPSHFSGPSLQRCSVLGPVREASGCLPKGDGPDVVCRCSPSPSFSSQSQSCNATKGVRRIFLMIIHSALFGGCPNGLCNT